jgi:hypothetical protein
MTEEQIKILAEMTFPQFRKYENDHSYFKIESRSIMTEIQQIGSYYTIHSIYARTLPDRNLINDLLLGNEGLCAISEIEFQAFEKECLEKRKLKKWQ